MLPCPGRHAFLTPLLTLGCFAFACAGGPWRAVDRARLQRPPTPQGAAAVNVRRETNLRFAVVDGRVICDERSSITRQLLGDRGRGDMGAGVSYSSTFDRVLEASSRLSRPDGTTKILARGDLVDQLIVGGGTAYQDQRYLSARFEDMPVGSIVDHHFVVRHLQPELFSHFETFAGALPDEDVSLTVELPPGFEVEHVVSEAWKVTEWAPERTAGPDGATQLRWRRTGVVAIEPEEWGPTAVDRATLVQVRLARWVVDGKVVQGFADEEAFGRWVHEIQGRAAEPDEAIRALVAKLLQGAPAEPAARAALLYGWVQTNIRYVAVEVGLGGWAAHPAAQVLAHGYGDCKDKATLLSAMLGVAGIPSRFVITHSHGGQPRRRLLPVIGVANNHAILAVDLPTGMVVVDPTTRSTPFGELPPGDQGAELLIVGAQGVQRLVSPRAEPGRLTRDVTIRLASPLKKSVTGTISIVAEGNAGDALEGISLDNEDEQRNGLRTFAALTASPVGTPRFARQVSAATRRVEARGMVRFEGLAQRSGPLDLVRLDRIVDEVVPRLRDAPRHAPLILGPAEGARWVVELALPADREVTLPEPFEQRDADLALAVRWSRREGGVTATVESTRYRRLFDAAEVPGVKQRYDAFGEALARPLIIKKKEAR